MTAFFEQVYRYHPLLQEYTTTLQVATFDVLLGSNEFRKKKKN